MNPWRRPRQLPADDGLSMVEVLWAMVIFAVLSTAVIATLLTAQGLVANNRKRSQAASVAASVMDAERTGTEDITARPVGRQVHPDVPVGGNEYHVVVDRSWITRTATPSSCSVASDRPYLSVHVIVSWDGIGSVRPVRSDTILTPRIGQVDEALGALSVRVLDRDGAPEANVPVTLSTGVTQETTEAGCALFPFLPAGTYTASSTYGQLVDRQGASTATTTTTVPSRTTSNAQLDLDRAATLQVDVSPNPSYPLPAAMQMTVYNSGLSSGQRALGPAVSGRFGSLYPYGSGYRLSAGTCATGSALVVSSQPGATTTASLPLAHAEVVITSAVGPPNSSTITFLQPAAGGCAAQTYTAPVNGGRARISLPSGTWQITSNRSLAGAPSLITDSSSSAVTSVTVSES